MRSYFLYITLFSALLIFNCVSNATATIVVEDPLKRANSYLEQGHYFLALQEVDSALQKAASKTQQSQAYGMKGDILLLMQRYSEAEHSLLQAFDLTEDAQLKAGYANSLGVLYYEMRDKNKPEQYFKSALELAGINSILKLKIRLNWLRAQPENAELPQLNELFSEISIISSVDDRVKYTLNLASIAMQKQQTRAIVQVALEKAEADSAQTSNKQLRLEALDSLAELYETQGKYQQALQLSEQASALSDQLDVDDLLINIEWRKGRIYQHQQRDDAALTAFRKAVDHIQAIRRDIPITYEDGKSSFREKLEPIYLGYAHHLLKASARQEGEAKQRTLQLARHTIEQIKQSELQDFLGGRCLIEGLQRSELENIDTDAAILYPIILPDRLELLVSINKGIRQLTVPIPEKDIRKAALSLSDNLRNWIFSPTVTSHDVNDHQQASKDLYQWIISPIEQDLARASIKTLVIVPDGVLRLVPFSALSDGKQYLIEKYAISISPGISLMGGSKDVTARTYKSLLAGLSKPGSVVDKLPEPIIGSILQTASANKSRRELPIARGLLSHRLRTADNKNAVDGMQVGNTSSHTRATQELQDELSLPGVEIEISSLKNTLKNTTLLNEQFTVSNFYQQLSNQSYEIIHIASHGLFSSDANHSFLMAYDDVLKLDDLKAFLKRDKNTQQGVQLLTLSACETAEGDDRAPLGFTGVALKADAQSALGSLWPISDEAASQLMIHFYNNLIQHRGKAESLRQAQLALLRSSDMNHPFFWSAFILVGNWL